jgi:hypothetical protein
LALTIDRFSSIFWLKLVGISFALLGIVYREATIWSVDQIEIEEQNKWYPSEVRKKRDKPIQQAATLLRQATIRIFLLVPIVAWLALICPVFQQHSWFMIILLFFALIPSIPHMKSKQKKKETTLRVGVALLIGIPVAIALEYFQFMLH